MGLAATVLDSAGLEGCSIGVWLLRLPDSKILLTQGLWHPYSLSILSLISITHLLMKHF